MKQSTSLSYGRAGTQIQVYLTPKLVHNHNLHFLWINYFSLESWVRSTLGFSAFVIPGHFQHQNVPYNVSFMNPLELLQSDAFVVRISFLDHGWLVFSQETDSRQKACILHARLDKVQSKKIDPGSITTVIGAVFKTLNFTLCFVVANNIASRLATLDPAL